MLTVSPVLRSSAAMPTSADLPATRLLSCCSRPTGSGRRPQPQAARRTPKATKRMQQSALPSPACSCAHTRIIAKRPHSFQIVKISDFGAENMHDYVVRIDEHPVGGRKSFNSNVSSKSLLDLVGKLSGHRCDLPRRATGRDHHVICDVRFARKGDGNHVLRLIVVKRLQDDGALQRRRECGRLRRRSQLDVRSRGLLATLANRNDTNA